MIWYTVRTFSIWDGTGNMLVDADQRKDMHDWDTHCKHGKTSSQPCAWKIELICV